MTPAENEPVTFRFVTQELNHCATAVPLLGVYLGIIYGNFLPQTTFF